MNDDTISRQAAIDAFRKELCRERVYATPFISFKGCERILNELPSERRIKMVEETFVIYVNGTVIARDVPQYMLTDLFDAAVRHFAALPEMSIRVEHTKKED